MNSVYKPAMSWIAGILLSALCLVRIEALNLDNVDRLEPIVRISPDKTATNNDYFGWAAIFHAIEPVQAADNMEDSLRKIRVIIGAPLGTFPGGLGYTDPFLAREDATGLVYNCPVFPGGCDGVRGDTTAYLGNADLANGVDRVDTSDPQLSNTEGRLFDQAPNSQVLRSGLLERFENKTGQLLGAFLYSDGDNLMACAHRWSTSLAADSLPRGVCYAGNRNLEGFIPLVPCSSNSQASSGGNSGTNREGFCVAGTSATVNRNSYVVGAPGFDSSLGMIASRMITGTAFTQGEKQAFANDGSNANTDTQYQGYQVVNAYITNPRSSGQPNLITSVPRQGVSYTGRIHLYSSPSTINTPILTAARGTQMAEFFGYSLVASDLNNDGYDEVLVGAPMYTDYASNENERGRVYIFMNNGTGSGDLNPEPIVLEGPGLGFRFGSSIASLGDIDRDGYPDIAIGAPYNISGSNTGNTGTVFIYYGREDPLTIPDQTPYTISADDIASSVDLALNGLTDLKTFGWSLSSGQDVDGNGYNDLVIGAYESQAVFVVRSLPVADVTVTFVPHPTVDIDQISSFDLEIQASFDGLGVASNISVDFLLREREVVSRRIYFQESDKSAPGTGTFVLAAKNTTVTATVTVFTEMDISNFNPYMIEIELLEIPRTLAPVTGNQTVSDLSPFPKIRHRGETTTQVEVENVCGSNGCASDLSFQSVTPRTVTVVVDGEPSVSLDVVIVNTGQEPALNIGLTISGIPSYVVSVQAINNIFVCPIRDVGTDILECQIQQLRLNKDETINGTLLFAIDHNQLIGNESDTSVDLTLSIADVSNNTDIEPSNNGDTVTFSPTGVADISLQLRFSPEMDNYVGVIPMDTALATMGLSALGSEINLVVTIGNAGPTTIGDAFFRVYLPLQRSNVTGMRYFLYPSGITPGRSPVTTITCDEGGLIDPENFGNSASSGRKRSASNLAIKRARREAMKFVSARSHVRKTRQDTPPSFDLDCSPGSLTRSECTMFSCSLSQLRRDNLTVIFNMRIDERFYGNLEQQRDFTFRAYGTAQINTSFVITGDDPSDNSGVANVTLARPVIEDDSDQPDLLHAILWPVLAGVLILIILIICLYFCGFFRRKRKPDEGEVEGDFNVDQFATPGQGASEKPMDTKEEITGL